MNNHLKGLSIAFAALFLTALGCSQARRPAAENNAAESASKTRVTLDASDTASMNVTVERGAETTTVDKYGWSRSERPLYRDGSDLPYEKESVLTSPTGEQWRTVEQLSGLGKPKGSKTWFLGTSKEPLPKAVLVGEVKFAADGKVRWQEDYNRDGKLTRRFQRLADGWERFVYDKSDHPYEYIRGDANDQQLEWRRWFDDGTLEVEKVREDDTQHYKWYRPNGTLKFIQDYAADPTLVDTTKDIYSPMEEYYRPGSKTIWLRKTSTGKHGVQITERFYRAGGKLGRREIVNNENDVRQQILFDQDGKKLCSYHWRLVQRTYHDGSVYMASVLERIEEFQQGQPSRSLFFDAADKGDSLLKEIHEFEDGNLAKILIIENGLVAVTKMVDEQGAVADVVEHMAEAREKAKFEEANRWPASWEDDEHWHESCPPRHVMADERRSRR